MSNEEKNESKGKTPQAAAVVDPNKAWRDSENFGVYVHVRSTLFVQTLIPGKKVMNNGAPVEYENRITAEFEPWLPEAGAREIGRLDLKKIARNADGELDQTLLEKYCSLLESKSHYEANRFGHVSCFMRFDRWKERWDAEADERRAIEARKKRQQMEAPPARFVPSTA